MARILQWESRVIPVPTSANRDDAGRRLIDRYRRLGALLTGDDMACAMSWLQCRLPSALVVTEPQAVLCAARADRYIATGW